MIKLLKLMMTNYPISLLISQLLYLRLMLEISKNKVKRLKKVKKNIKRIEKRLRKERTKKFK